MVHLLTCMVQKAEKDGQKKKLKSAVDTAMAVKVMYEQRFLDEDGVINDNKCAGLIDLCIFLLCLFLL